MTKSIQTKKGKIIFTLSETHVDAQVNYHIKDLFKDHFPSSKWKDRNKIWRINQYEGLEEAIIEFIDNNGDSFDELAIRLEEKENQQRVIYAINSISTQLEKLREKDGSLDEVLRKAEENKAVLEKLKVERKELNDRVEEKTKSLVATLSEIKTDKDENCFDLIDEIKSNAVSYSRSKRATDKKEAENYQKLLRDLNEKIEDATGISFKFIKKSYGANMNRLDRDMVDIRYDKKDLLNE
jgi:hypothetical protein